MLEHFLAAMDHAVALLKDRDFREVTLFHHNDTDGLSSGTILLEAFTDIDYTVQRHSLEKPYPQVLEKVFSSDNQLLIFADFAGKIAPIISEMNQKRNLVIILDHHPAEVVDDPTVCVLDGELFGLKGDRDISASATCYLFADRLLKSFGKGAEKYAHLGALGAIGDGFYVDGALSGINKTVLDIAIDRNTARREKHSTGENYFIHLGAKEYSAEEICTVLDTVGGVGYYQNGVAVGIEICRQGIDESAEAYVAELMKKKDDIFAYEVAHITENLHTTEHLQWFDVAGRFQPMGVKMIGVFCTYIKDMPFLDASKYLAGFQHIPDEVPGFGDIDFNSTKISMRVSERLTQQIRAKEMPGLNTFLADATKVLGGFSDACHGLSAATTIKIGQESLLIDEIEHILRTRVVKHE